MDEDLLLFALVQANRCDVAAEGPRSTVTAYTELVVEASSDR
jgi:hypothetical protein